MAGIGFALNRLYRSDSLANRAVSLGHATVIAAGPCLFAVLGIYLITTLNSELEGQSTIAAFRALVIYSFALSFVITAPIGLVSCRLISDKLHDRDVAAVPGIVLIAVVLSALAVVAAAGVLFGVVLDLDGRTIVAAVVNSAVVGLVWIGCLFCSITRDYNAVTVFFGGGMIVAVAGVTGAYALRPALDVMLWGFAVGLGVTLFGLLTRIIATIPFATRTLAAPARELGRAFATYWPIAVGGLFGALGAWVDKWIVWLSPFGTQIQSGLLHSPLYDSAMFASYLVALPAYAAFVLHLEVEFFRNYRVFYAGILEHATLNQIRANGTRLREQTIAALSGIMVPQIVICALVAISAPVIVDLIGMQFRQVGTIRFGLVGAVCQFLFVTCSSLTLYFDRRMMFLALQACFLLLNAAFTVATLPLGWNYLGLGFLCAGAISAAIAYLALVATLYRLDYLTFIANNPAVRIR